MFERSFSSLRMTLPRSRTKIVAIPLPDMRGDACAGKRFVANFPSMMWCKRFFFLCALVSVFALSAWSQDAADSQAVRPSGVTGPIRKAKAVTAKEKKEAEVDSPYARKTKRPKWIQPCRHGNGQKQRETIEAIPAPTES